jgi:hypothetical protein
MVWMEVSDDEGVHGRLVETQPGESVTDRIASRFPIGAAVEQEDSVVRLDRICVDPGRALERQRRRDQVDAVAQ